MEFGLRVEALVGHCRVGRIHRERRHSWHVRAYLRSVREHGEFRNIGRLEEMQNQTQKRKWQEMKLERLAGATLIRANHLLKKT